MAAPVTPAVAGDKNWPGLVAFINQRRRPLGSRLEHGCLLQLELPKLKIGFPRQYFNLVDGDLKAKIEVLAQEYFSAPVKVDFQLVNGEQQAPPLHLTCCL